MATVQEIVAGLEHLESVQEVWELARRRMAEGQKVLELAKRRMAEGDASFLADLGIGLTERYGSEPYRWVIDHLLRLLTLTPGRENVEQALRLTADGGDRMPVRYTAALLASGQAPQDLDVVFSDGSSRAGASEELRACLVHELVLRGVSVEERLDIAGWVTSPHWNYHPLGRLPLSLTELEGQPALPRYSVSAGVSCDLSYGLFGGSTIRPDNGSGVLAATETTTDATASVIAAAVADWGRIEARVYEFAEEIDAGAVAGVLLTLGLECLRGLGPGDRFMFSSECAPGEAWDGLFKAASMGGAYTRREYGAYGRLATWRSVAALAGAPADAPPAEIEQLAHTCAWYCFGADTGWFAHAGWDIGIVVLTADRRRLAVLAATDTD